MRVLSTLSLLALAASLVTAKPIRDRRAVPVPSSPSGSVSSRVSTSSARATGTTTGTAATKTSKFSSLPTSTIKTPIPNVTIPVDTVTPGDVGHLQGWIGDVPNPTATAGGDGVGGIQGVVNPGMSSTATAGGDPVIFTLTGDTVPVPTNMGNGGVADLPPGVAMTVTGADGAVSTVMADPNLATNTWSPIVETSAPTVVQITVTDAGMAGIAGFGGTTVATGTAVATTAQVSATQSAPTVDDDPANAIPTDLGSTDVTNQVQDGDQAAADRGAVVLRSVLARLLDNPDVQAYVKSVPDLATLLVDDYVGATRTATATAVAATTNFAAPTDDQTDATGIPPGWEGAPMNGDLEAWRKWWQTGAVGTDVPLPTDNVDPTFPETMITAIATEALPTDPAADVPTDGDIAQVVADVLGALGHDHGAHAPALTKTLPLTKPTKTVPVTKPVVPTPHHG